jgi:ferric-dicitrate binding protein FerR (iron transport regulator)
MLHKESLGDVQGADWRDRLVELHVLAQSGDAQARAAAKDWLAGDATARSLWQAVERDCAKLRDTDTPSGWIAISAPNSATPRWRRSLPDGGWLVVGKPVGHRYWQWAHHRADGERCKWVGAYHLASRARECADACYAGAIRSSRAPQRR